MSEKPVNVIQATLPSLEDFIPYSQKIWNLKVLTNGGQLHQQLEAALCEYLGVKHVALFNNATVIIVTALQALRILGEVITTSYSFVARTRSLLWNGINPVFVDIDPFTLNLNPAEIEVSITPHTTAFMPVHCYGHPCDVDAISKTADKYNLNIIYGAAHPFDVKRHCRSVLNHGDSLVISFHDTKVFNTFEGRAFVCPDAKIKWYIDQSKSFGFVDEAKVVAPGINGKMSEINAAFGLFQLKYVDEAIVKHKSIDEAYRKAPQSVSGIRCLQDAGEHAPYHSYFPVLAAANYLRSRGARHQKLKESDIFAHCYFCPLITDFAMYRGVPSAQRENMLVATASSQTMIYLSIHPNLAAQEIQRVIDICKSSVAFTRWIGVVFNEDKHMQLWVPAGLAHGFFITDYLAEFMYKSIDYHSPEYERCIAWDDPAIGIDWPVLTPPQLATKDKIGASSMNAEVFK